MSVLAEILILIFLCSLYALIHSLLAAEKVKYKVSQITGKLFAFYRFFYVAVSVLLFYLLIELAPRLDMAIYDLEYPFDLLMFGVQILAFAGFYWALRYNCIKEFLGFSQIERFIKGTYAETGRDSNSTLVFIGPYKYTRHPVYFFLLIFLMARPFMDLQYLVFLVCAVIYFYIGTDYEEKKLINKFGNDYSEYMSKVPKIIPYKIFRGKSG